jgi:two-component system response regulator PilR (NtrC family)
MSCQRHTGKQSRQSHRPATGPSARTQRNETRFVLIDDPDPQRRALIASAVRACKIEPVVFTDPGVLSDRAPGDTAVAGLIGLDGREAPIGPLLDIIRRLRHHGVGIICYGQGVSALPTTYCCKLLVAGARCVLDSGAADFAGDLRARLTVLLEEDAAHREEQHRRRALMVRLGVAGESLAIVRTMKWVERVSRFSHVPVLITGETGTGKELVARGIHVLDPLRRDGPFVAVNCGAIHPHLVEDELFGHRRGAFTGAVQERAGLVRSAAGGVLFLDEIAEMDPALQTRLLRVIQNRAVTGLGEDRERRVDVRIIAATNQDLKRRVAEKRFREDLYFRINVLSIRLPPLRARPEDIGPLCEHFIERFEDLRCGRRITAGKRFLDVLARLRFPGNVRELENLIRHALAHKEDEGALDLSDLPPQILHGLAAAEPRVAQAGRRSPGAEIPAATTSPLAVWVGLSGWRLSAFIDHCERCLIEAALSKNGGSRTKAARLLGVSSRTIYNKMRKHGLAPHRLEPGA